MAKSPTTTDEIPRPSRLDWHTIDIDGRRAEYGVAGSGHPVVFLHGWGLSNHTYKAALKRLLAEPIRLYAPALPGFGDSQPLADPHATIADYGHWVGAFCHAVEIDEPAVVIGHSFGGGVAITTAHAHPDQVRALILLNSIGGSAWRNDRGVVESMAQRPLWDWGLHLPADIRPARQLRRVLPVILEAAIPNAIRNPRAVWHAAGLARHADLTPELEALKARGMPIAVVWGTSDEVVTRASYEAMEAAVGGEHCYTVEGGHSWLLSDPDRFGEVITNVMQFAQPVATRRGKRRGPTEGLPRLRTDRSA